MKLYKNNKLILFLFLLLLTYIIYFTISNSYVIEGFSNNQDYDFVNQQKDYYNYREKSEITGSNKLNDMSQANNFFKLDFSKPSGKQLVMTTTESSISNSQTNQSIGDDIKYGNLKEKCKNITDCSELDSNPQCGYCFSTKQFEAGNENGPYFNVCPSGWSNSKSACIKQKEQNICKNISSCQTMTGDANICGWCQASGKAFVATKDSTGKLIPKYSDDTCNDNDDLGLGLVPPGQCKQFGEEHPCISPNMDTGPHSDSCLDNLWKEAGGTIKGTAAPQNNPQQKKDWNQKSWQSVFDDMKAWVSDANSNDWSLVKTHYKGVYGNDPDPCDSKFSPTPIECYQKLFTQSGCLEKGNAYPNSTNYNNYKTQSQSGFISFVKGLLGMSHNNSVSFDEKNSAYENCYGGQLQAPPPLKPGDEVKYTGGTFYGPNSILQGYICSIDSNNNAKVFWTYISGPDGNPQYSREDSNDDQTKINKMGAYCGQVPFELIGKGVPSEINIKDLKLIKACTNDSSCITGSCDMQNIVYVSYSKSVPNQFRTYNILKSQIRDVLEKANSIYPSTKLANYSDIQYLVNSDLGYCYSGWVNNQGTITGVYPSNSTSVGGCGYGEQKVIEWYDSKSNMSGAYLYVVGNPADMVSKLASVGLKADIVATVGKKSYTGETDFTLDYNPKYPKYLGCFIDKSSRTLTNKIGDGLDPIDAIKTAQEKGYKYVGLQDASQWGWNKVQAWAGNDSYNKYGTSSNCKSVSNTYVGGPWVNAVYQLKD